MIRWLVVLAALFLVAPTFASADIYQCRGPDGKTVFTGEPTACPGAKRHVLKKKVQNVLDERSSPVLRGGRPAARANRRSAQGDGLEAMWRRKRPTAEQELKQVEARAKAMKQVVTACNRGSEWYTTEASGIRKHIPCSELRERNDALVMKQRELAAYLVDGLEDECRRAGCKPGWVR